MAGKQPVTELDTRCSGDHATPAGWEEARGHLEDAQVHWLSTVRPAGKGQFSQTRRRFERD